MGGKMESIISSKQDNQRGVESSSSERSHELAKFLLIVVPLVLAPVAFYYSRKYSTNSSPVLESILIAAIAFEFYFILLSNKGPFSKIAIFDDDEPRMEITVLELECGDCGKIGEYYYDGNKIPCMKCEVILEFELDQESGEYQIEDPSPAS